MVLKVRTVVFKIFDEPQKRLFKARVLNMYKYKSHINCYDLFVMQESLCNILNQKS